MIGENMCLFCTATFIILNKTISFLIYSYNLMPLTNSGEPGLKLQIPLSTSCKKNKTKLHILDLHKHAVKRC